MPLIKVPCNVPFDKDTSLEGIKVWVGDSIEIYLTTSSILKAFNVVVPEDGWLMNQPVVAIQTLFDCLETELPDVAEKMVATTDYVRKAVEMYDLEVPIIYYEDAGRVYVPVDTLIPLLVRQLPKHIMIKVLKITNFGLDGSPLIELAEAKWLLKKYRHKLNNKVKSSKGFANCH